MRKKSPQAFADRDFNSTSYELGQLLHRRAYTDTTRETSSLRDAIINGLAPENPGPLYDPEAMALVREFEAALRADWERIEVSKVRQAAEKAVADALGLPAQWRLL